MPQVNDISLSNAEFDELKLLVEAKRNGSIFPMFATERLDPDGFDEFPDQELVQIYKSLEKKGMITGRPRDGAFTFISLRQSGIDFVDDYKRKVKEDSEAEKSKRRHDYLVTAFECLVSAFVGLFTV